MLYQRTCCVILPRRIVVGRQFIGGLDFFAFVRGGGSFFLSTQAEVCCTEISVLQQHASNTKHFFFFPLFLFFVFRKPASWENSGLLFCSAVRGKSYTLSFPPFDRKPHAAHLILRCITITPSGSAGSEELLPPTLFFFLLWM